MVEFFFMVRIFCVAQNAIKLLSDVNEVILMDVFQNIKMISLLL